MHGTYTKPFYFKNELMTIATWIIFELVGVGAAQDLIEPQTLKNVSLLMMINQTFTFRCTFCKKWHHV